MAKRLADVLETFGLLDKGGAVVIPYAVSNVDRVTESDAHAFKSALSRDCGPYFFGMWDCVRIYGVLRGRGSKPGLAAHTPFGYHALAIDEQRLMFRPYLWAQPAFPDQTIEQVWFASVHSDVCGGYTETGASDIALRWMVDKANASGMLFDADGLGHLAPDPLAPVHDSRKHLMWRLFRRSVRQIPRDSLIHPSVVERQQQQPAYCPSNLTVVNRRRQS